MQPFSLLIKPAGPDCNLDCRYCFYKNKTDLFAPGPHRMSLQTLEALVQNFLSLNFPVSSFAWQGGEPTLVGLDFYKQTVEFQKRFDRKGQQVSNSIQTNGILLDEDWCRFLHENNFLVGISLDGPQDLHDFYRKDLAGNESWQRVIDAIDRCLDHQVEFNILVLLNRQNVQKPDEIFDFLLENEFLFWQFIPCVETDPKTGQIAEYSITPGQYGDFLCRLFDRWLEHTDISIRLFDTILSYFFQDTHSDCTFKSRCEDYLVIEHNGDVYPCDFFVEPSTRLGNIHQESLARLIRCDAKQQFARRKRSLPNPCLICPHKLLCMGGCPKDRRILSDSFASPSYFCTAYKQFFSHALPLLRQIAAHLALENRR